MTPPERRSTHKERCWPDGRVGPTTLPTPRVAEAELVSYLVRHPRLPLNRHHQTRTLRHRPRSGSHDRRRLTFQTPHFQRACLVNHSPFMAEPQYRQVRGISEMKGAGTLEEMEHHPQVKRLPCPANALPRPPAFQFVMPEADSCPAP